MRDGLRGVHHKTVSPAHRLETLPLGGTGLHNTRDIITEPEPFTEVTRIDNVAPA
jgi:hypothetical protein